MDSINLLAREDEFKKLNKQLEKKSESLMKQIEQVLQKPDSYSEFTTPTKKHSCDMQKQLTPTRAHKETRNVKSKSKISNSVSEQQVSRLIDADGSNNNLNNGPQQITVASNSVRTVCDCCNVKSNDMEFLYAFVCVHVKDKLLPQSYAKDNITVEKVCKFLSSKIKLLQEKIDKLQSTISSKTTQCEAHLTRLADLENERMSLLNKNSNLRTTSIEMKAKCHSLQNRLEEKDKLYKEQRSVADTASNELKKFKTKVVGLEARCASHEDVIDNLKQQIETLKINEKEIRDSTRNLSSASQAKITKLEAHVNAQNKQIDRQTRLISNLRRQISLMSTSGALKVLEQEYCKLLDEI
ncbi:testis-expressed protein 9-like [Bombyx mandarina]|uniref:Testis-expressed protein 9-like n=1 Tax=Bombyx mandarina TaxID=7092 RepID=A0A6J2KLM4_BOMMA|nr:testis-expressed protein 9-like [Bombyx mandarina]